MRSGRRPRNRRGRRRAGLQGSGEARRGSNDADLGRHFHLAKKFFADRLHVEVNGAGWFRDKLDSAKFERSERAGRAFL
jgi:hypothetical protein